MKLIRSYASLFLLGLLFPLASFTQIANNPIFSETESLLNTRPDLLMNHSGHTMNSFHENNDPLIATRKDNWINNAWLNSDSLEYYYNENNLLVERLSRHFSNNQWNYAARVIYEYDANNNEISEIRQNILPAGYVNVLRYTSEYDANNNRTLYVLQYWVGSSWSNVGSKEINEYDDNSNKTYYLLQYWINGTPGYVNDNQISYEYDASNNLIWWQQDTWQNFILYPWRQWFSYYDANNNLTQRTEHVWNSNLNEWSTSYIDRTWDYDINNNQTHLLVQFGNGVSFGLVEQIFFEHDENNNLSNLIVQDWDVINSVWVNDVKGIWEYDANNNNILYLYQTGNQWDSSWLNQSRYSWEYDANNNKISDLFQYWDEDSWVNSTRMIYYYGLLNSYSDNTTFEPGFTIYPNPNNGIFKLDLGKDDLQDGNVNIYNAYGLLVYSQTIKSEDYNKSLNLTKLTEGTYFVQVLLGDKLTTQTFIIAN